jgi:predicted GNAT family acetyltransferase
MPEQLRDNTANNRYEYTVDGALCFVAYRRSPGVVALTHAEVPPALEGRGVGSRMVRAILDQVRVDGDKVVPLCSFVVAFIRRHPEFQDLVAA